MTEGILYVKQKLEAKRNCRISEKKKKKKIR